MFKKRSTNNLKKSCYLLSGITYCGYCGAKFRYQKWGKDTIKMYCYSQQKSRPRLIRDPNCPNCKANADEVEKYVLDELFKLSLDDNYFDKRMSDNVEDTQKITEDKLKEVNKQIQNLVRVLSEGFFTVEIKTKIKSLENEKKKLEKKLLNNKKKEIGMQKMKSKIMNLNEVWGDLSYEEKRNILISLINRVVIKDDQIMIHYNSVI